MVEADLAAGKTVAVGGAGGRGKTALAVELAYRGAPDARVRARPGELQQVLFNILLNSVQAMQGAGRIDIEARPGADGFLAVSVRDTGPGIPRESLARVFDPFFTTKPPGEGTGLGLFLSYGIAETHGGTLAVDSIPGEGAKFVMSLPVAAPSRPQAVEAAHTPAQRTDAAPRRILVVDDDPAVRRLVSVLFAHDGHTVDSAADGAEGLKMARGMEYDLILSDRRAAANGEPFVTALLREHPPWKGRTLLAASEQRPGAPDEQGAGLRFLRKPFNLRDLRAAATAVWSGAQAGS